MLFRSPKPMLISFIFSSEPSESQGLLQILDLLTDLLDLRLHIHHDAGDIQILTLGTNGIGLTVQLLGQEIQLAAHGLVQLQNGAVLGDVAAQADGLIIHGGLVAKDGSLGQDTGIIDVPVLQNDLEFFVQEIGRASCRERV